MFQGILFLAAISAAFPSVISQISSCDLITEKLQGEFRKEDPHTFPNISNFIDIRDDIILNFHFSNLIFKGFSNVYCNSNDFGQGRLVILILSGSNLEFKSSDTEIDINLPDFAGQLKTSFTSQLYDYTLELRFIKDAYSPDPFKLCIKKESLEIIFQAYRIKTNVGVNPKVTQELNNHPEAVAEAINLYIHRFADTLTTTLNNILCPISH
ncbi:uncharacterized protein [Palaemon carinicauda]|uniref:uncharacterized protein n=1 Tax=Palaemon carinicauda TaxID=392227 RepID=UPI0035B5EE9C